MMPITEMEAERRTIEAVLTRRRDVAARVFAAAQMPRLEAALAEAGDGLGEPLGALRPAMMGALGVQGAAGRRWRPLLTLAAAQACGAPAAVALDAAVAVELTHTASLVLDDLPCMDDTPLRRGEPATHRRVGAAGAILVAIGLLGRSAELLARSTGGATLGARWGRAIGLDGMAGGQAIDVAVLQGRAVRGAKRRLHREKTVGLSGFALEAGALAAGADAGACTTLARYGRHLGWAYQLADDAADLEQDRAAGRAPGGRLPERQSARLLARADALVRRTPGFAAPRADAMLGLGRAVVTTDGPWAPGE